LPGEHQSTVADLVGARGQVEQGTGFCRGCQVITKQSTALIVQSSAPQQKKKWP